MAKKFKMADSHGHVAASADFNVAFRYHQGGALDAAAAAYQKVLSAIPNHFDALHMLGVIEFNRRNLDRSVELLEQAIRIKPDVAVAHMNYGNTLRARGRIQDAIAHYKRAIQLQPDLEHAHLNLVKTALESGEFEMALRHADIAIALNPNNADSHNDRGNAQLGLKQIQLAEDAFRSACRLNPRFVASQSNLGNLLIQNGRIEEGFQCHRIACELAPSAAAAHYNLGVAMLKHGGVEESIGILEQATKLAPRMAEAWNALGVAQRAMGYFDLAIESFNRAIEIRPDYAEAFRHLVGCRRAGTANSDISRLEALLKKKDLSREERIAGRFALGKLHDDEARYDEAFANFRAANDAFGQYLVETGKSFEPDQFRAYVEEIIARTTPHWLGERQGWGNLSKVPVFILGAPRSGTSLVEQIISSHPNAYGAGELRDIGLISTSKKFDDAVEVRAASDAYLARLRTLAPEARAVTDKMPDNIFSLWAIAVLFPNARVILCRRDLRDIGLSCYMTRFSSSQYAFSYNLKHCGERICETERLASHWLDNLALRMLEVNYESLVTDFENQSRRLIEFLDLPWTPVCLEFNKTRRAVTTASAWQVRQPLYRKSVGRWHHYEKHLAPLISALKIAEN
ncbi:MAG: tetratricopeptide repeat protein [Thiobacillaceae bacterium]